MKSITILFVVVLCLGGYAYFQIFLPDQKVESTTQLDIQKIESLRHFNVTSEEKSIKLSKREGFWWVVEPDEYLADQEFIEKAIQIMTSTPVINQFPLAEDRFGLTPGRAFVEWVFEDGLHKRFIIGSEVAPNDGIYVLDKDSNEVKIYHNVWGQVLYYPLTRFYHRFLPIPGNMVKKISLKRNSKLLWSLSPAPDRKMKIHYQSKDQVTGRAQWVWFFKKIREFSVLNLQFNKESKFKSSAELIVESDKGNIRFLFNEKSKQIYIPELNVFAEFDPYSLNSLGYEIEKVMNSDKK